MTESCGKCKFWNPTPGPTASGEGQCRLHPPKGHVLIGGNGQPVVIGYFPPSPINNWCAQFQVGIALNG